MVCLIFVDGNGWVVSPEDIGALSNALTQALANSELLAKMGEQSKITIERLAGAQLIARKHIELYRKLLAS